MTWIALSDIRIDGGTQSRASIDQQAVDDYAAAMAAGDKFPPVVVYFDGKTYWLADGFHRYQAYASAKIDAVPADVRQGTQRDAILFSVSANASHGLRRTNDDKRRAVQTLLNDAEWAKWSDREIARRCAVHHDLVGKLRPVVTGVSASERTYTTKHGTKAEMKTAKIGAQSKADPVRIVATSEPGPQTALKIVEEAAAAPPLPADPVEAKIRREFRALTSEAQEDAYVGVMLDLQDCKAVTAKLKTERDSLKAQVKDLSASDSGAVIRRLQAEADNAKNAKWREGEKALAFQKQIYALKKELKALGATEIPL
jgi:hypothetical protein